MEEGSMEQYQRQEIQENARDLRAIKWGEELKSAEKKPQQVIGEFAMGGAKITNFVTDSTMGWEPSVIDQGRKMILFTGNILGGQWGVESLKQGLSFANPLDSSKSIGAKNLSMVPYPRFSAEGNIDLEKSKIFLFDDKQIEDLKKLIYE